MNIVTILGAAVIVGVFALIVVMAAKKTGEKAAAAENALRQEDKDWLRATEYQAHPVKAGDRVHIILNGDKSARIAWDFS